MKHVTGLFKLFITVFSLAWCSYLAGNAYAQHDIYIKDNELDDGSVPSSSPYWVSPDIWFRNDGNCMQTGNHKPIPGTSTTVCVQIHNRMEAGISNITVNAYWADVGQPLSWPGSWNFINSFIITELAGNSDAVSSVSWEVPLGVQELGLLIRANAPDDPIDTGPDTVVPTDNVENNNNIAQRNISFKPFILFSPDIPLNTEIGLFAERDIILYNQDSGFHLIVPGPLLGIPERVNLDALGFFEQYVVFSTDIPFDIESSKISERNLIGNDFMGSLVTFLDGQNIGIPDGAEIDAAMVLPNGWIVFSLDIPGVIGEIPFSHNDLILWSGSFIDIFFRGSDVGIPEWANIDGVFLIEDGDEDGIPTPGTGFGAEVLFSLDIPTEINGVAFTEKDIIRCGEPPCSKYNDALSSTLPMNMDVDAFAIMTDNCPEYPNPAQEDMDEDGLGDPCDGCTDIDQDGYGNPGFPNTCEEDNCPFTHNPGQEDSYPPQGNGCGDACECEGNFDGDADQDGSDAFTFKVDFGRSSLGNPCVPENPCNGNFNCDQDVDGSDAFIFKEDFGRSSLGNPCPECVRVPWCE